MSDIRAAVSSRWFAWVYLACVAISALLWELLPQLRWLPLIVALLPWAARLASGRFPFRRTPLDVPVWVFFFSAVSGLWASYDPTTAWVKFWFIVAAICMYYALANQPQANANRLPMLAGLLAALLAIYLLLTHNWEAQPADIRLLNQVGSLWQRIRPPLPLPSSHPNIIGGLLAALLPFNLAWALQAWMGKHRRELVAALVAGAIGALGLLMTSSRAAWAALALALAVWGWWAIATWLAQRLHTERGWVFGGGLALVLLAAIGGATLFPDKIIALAGAMPGEATGGSRLEIYQYTWGLLSDFVFTGGGLAAFPGLYSQYVLNIPYFKFSYSHNVFLDVALEQGIFGLLAWVGLLVGSFWLLLRQLLKNKPDSAEGPLLQQATLIGLVVLCLHGLVDDAFYGIRGTPLLLLLPGIVIAVTGVANRRRTTSRSRADPVERMERFRAIIIAGTLIVATAGALLISGYRAMIAQWYADLGAVSMARAELNGWPERRPDTTSRDDLTGAEALLYQALRYDANNPTARYRLGLIFNNYRDYKGAVEHLEIAFQGNPAQRGIRKSLGYGYVWVDRLDLAVEVLRPIPEAAYELEIYSQWWKTQGREDLAELAAKCVKMIEGEEP